MKNNFFKSKLSKTQKLFENQLEQIIESNFPEMERINCTSKQEFKEKYLTQEKPFVITGLIDDWDALKEWNLDFFKEKCADVEIKANLYDPRLTYDTDIKTIIERMQKGDKEAYIQEWWFNFDCPFLDKYYSIPNIFSDDLSFKTFRNYSTFMFVGSENSSSYLHQDSLHTNIWSAQIQGKKKWYFFGREAIMEETSDGLPNVDKFINDPKSEIMHVTLNPGEVVYFPSNWWHRTKLLDTSISVHGLYITKDIFANYIKDMFAISLATALNSKLIYETDRMRHHINELSCRVFAKMMNFDPEDVLEIKKSSQIKDI